MSTSAAHQTKRDRPIAVFMGFGTKGDVYPIAAIAVAFASDMKQYSVFFITHSAHQNLSAHLAREFITYVPISTPPALSFHEAHNETGSAEASSCMKRKMKITSNHRQECITAVETIFGCAAIMKDDFIVINFFALEGWSLAELFEVNCMVAAPYVVPYSAPTSFESHFQKELPLLYKYLLEAPSDKVGWKDVLHWMWPLFTENWGSWREHYLKLSPVPFTDPVTGLPTWHERAPSPLLFFIGRNLLNPRVLDICYCKYLFLKDCTDYSTDYWPSNTHVCGFWFLPAGWDFSCHKCSEAATLSNKKYLRAQDRFCSSHNQLQTFLMTNNPKQLVFIGLSSIGSMGFLSNPRAFLMVLQTVTRITDYRFILFTADYEPLNTAALAIAAEEPSSACQREFFEDQLLLFDGRLFCFSGTIPYRWLFTKCAAAVHHGGSGSTAAALHAGIAQVICPFMLDQFYWAERMFWLGVASEPLKRCYLIPDKTNDASIKEAAHMLSSSLSATLSGEITARCSEISSRISIQDGVTEAVRILKKEITNFASIR